MKVHVIYEHTNPNEPHSTSHIRLLRPLQHPSIADSFQLSYNTQYRSADVTIVERLWQPQTISLAKIEALVKQIRQDNTCLIYSLDDNLLDLPSHRPSQTGLTPEQLMVIRYLVREADGVLVSTENLKQRLLRINPHIFVVPNAIDEQLLRKNLVPEAKDNRQSRKQILGYMGTYTHDADIMMVLQALREALYKYGNTWELQFVGGISESSVIEAFSGMPYKILDVGKFGEYPDFVRWIQQNINWDLAIAPLETNYFSNCKSDIKFLDYSALGIPGIYSNVSAYNNTIRHLETGYLTDNHPEAWVEALDFMMATASQRQTIADQAKEYVFSQRTLQHTAWQWRDAIQKIFKNAKNHRKNYVKN
jgi:glycosyltransferase involved in cell wall biosynthesis